MASRGSRISRVLEFFREGDADEARVAHVLVNEIMAKRVKVAPKQVRKKRTSKADGAAPAHEQQAAD